MSKESSSATGSSAELTQMRSLKAKLSQIKAQCTRCRTYLDKVNIEQVSIIELRQRLQKFSETWSSFNEIQTTIEELEVRSGEEEDNNETRRLFEDKYFEITSELEYLIERKLGGTHVPVFNPMPRNMREGTPATQGSNVSNDHLKLPRVNLPTFAGAFEEWIPFRNMFQSMIDQNAALPDVQKMQYLLSALKGEARDVISSLEVSEENYGEAWEMLRERYDDSGFIIQKHIRALFEIPALIKENHTQLRRLLDSVLKHLRALRALKRPTEHWDDLMIHLITSRLDPKTNRAWEVTLKKGEVATLKQLTDFLAQHGKALEASSRATRSSLVGANSEKAKTTAANLSTVNHKCAYCNSEEHAIYKCGNYLQLEIDKRIKEARSRKLCLNCLKGTSHVAKQCKARPCYKCNKRHNTLLHLEESTAKNSEEASKNESSVEQNKVSVTSINCAAFMKSEQVLLATAEVKIFDNQGNAVLCRALLDSGSQSCFITSDLAKKLALKQTEVHIPVCGLSGIATQSRRRVKATIQSRINKFKVSLDCLVIDRITQAVPSNQIKPDELQIPDGILLADPEFREPATVDLLLGAEVFFDLMCIGRIRVSKTQPTWQKTLLGWIISGNLASIEPKQKGTICGLITNEQLNSDLTRFWQVEHNERQITRTPEERNCEGHFAKTYKRNEEGRFIVSLPTKEEQLGRLGESRDIAMQRFKKLERRFEVQPQLKIEYAKFMQEYIDLKHMREIREDDPRWHVQPQYYLPHHCVLREESTTTKLRVVFDASSKTTSGVSLNDVLMTGPVLQQDLFSILLRFRSFEYVMTSDIAKMYRQVLVNEEQVALQRIIWRNQLTEDLTTYELLTLTYGTAPASFLATKVIQKLAKLEEDNLPKGAMVAERDFYMDDLITGANSKKEALTIRNEIIALLRKGGLELRKWASNSEDLLKDIPRHATSDTILELTKDNTSKTLGIKWNHKEDIFQYSICVKCQQPATKRSILSSISQVFDPLGVLTPVIVTAKMLIQELWKLQVEWDESLPSDIHSRWLNYISDMQELNEFCVPRKVMGDGATAEIQLHGFCDASEKAYGACAYLRSVNKDGSVQVRLLCAKSRVAPIKTISIPRLELCGAQLLAQLITKIKASLSFQVVKVYCWTDSSIVLHWIGAVNKKLPVFVAHRVGEIQELTAVEDWKFVGTKENPADLASRGCKATELGSSQLWWRGPKWLEDQEKIDRPWKIDKVEEEALELREARVVLSATEAHEEDFISKFSTFQKLIRVIATCLRFAQRCRKKKNSESSQALTVEELEDAKRCIIKREQQSYFKADIQALQRNKMIPKNSALKHLNPWLDSKGLLRVGGRLERAEVQDDVKHPIVLPHKSRLTELILLHEHARNYHSGAEATLAAVRQLYWPIRARGAIKKLIYNCVKCFKARPRKSEQMMADLPVDRVTISNPFTNTGVDFCGPIYIRDGRRRGAKRVKTYVAVFVCMAVKAVHLEIVSDLTTDAFLNAFKRFISRRGRPSNVYSDNGTNFVGANRELKECSKLFSEKQQDSIIDQTAPEGIKWHFIPARAPHFGGLWESAVKSFKTYFYKTAAEASMTFEEAATLITQIEAILNSRPLIALSADSNDLNYLSPGHFLIGKTITSYPEIGILEVKVNRLSRWQMVERIRQHFWKRWSSEYLTSLQRRSKWWKSTGPQIEVGQLVLCKEDGLPPLKWAVGRIKSVSPGADGIVRTAIVKTSSGEFKRPAAKLCILPLEDSKAE